MDPLNAIEAKARRKEEAAKAPRGLGKILIRESSAGFNNRNRIALFAKAKGRD
jgi:hypothetical protein